MAQEKLENARNLWTDMLAQTGNDSNYRNTDYENGAGRYDTGDWNSQWMDDDVATISKLIALYAVTKDGAEDEAKNPFQESFTKLDPEEAKTRCKNISEGIVSFLNDCKSLASGQRVQRRLIEAEPGTAKYVEITDDYTARGDAFAYESLKNLTDVLRDNHALDAINRNVKNGFSPDKLETSSMLGDRTLFGNFFTKSAMKEGRDPITGAITTEAVRDTGTVPLGGNGYRGIAQNLMLGIANTIENREGKSIAKNLKESSYYMAGINRPNTGIRMLFMENPDERFLQAAEELNAGKRDWIIPAERSDAATSKDMLQGMPSTQTEQAGRLETPADAATFEDMMPKKEAEKEETPEEKFERLAAHAEKADNAVQPANLVDKNGNERYRNADYNNYELTSEDLELAGKIVALYAKTTADMGPVLPDEEDLERRTNIGEAIGRFVGQCGELVGEERVQERVIATKNGFINVEDDFSARKERHACQCIADLSNTLMANAFLRYMDPAAESQMTFEQIEYASDMNRNTFLGRYHAAEGASAQDEISIELPYKDENGNAAKYQIVEPRHKDTLDFVKYFQDTDHSSYALMVAMAKSIEDAGTEGLKKELNRSGNKGAATRMLFKAETDKSFEAAANELAEKSKQNGVIVNDFR